LGKNYWILVLAFEEKDPFNPGVKENHRYNKRILK